MSAPYQIVLYFTRLYWSLNIFQLSASEGDSNLCDKNSAFSHLYVSSWLPVMACMCLSLLLWGRDQPFFGITWVQFCQIELKPVRRVSADANLKIFPGVPWAVLPPCHKLYWTVKHWAVLTHYVLFYDGLWGRAGCYVLVEADTVYLSLRSGNNLFP